jgi:Ca2+-binding EF-hand superfamily protein
MSIRAGVILTVALLLLESVAMANGSAKAGKARAASEEKSEVRVEKKESPDTVKSPTPAPLSAPGAARTPFAELDRNGDGVVSSKEFGKGRKEAFKIFDADGDGKISREEYEVRSERAFLTADLVFAYMFRWDADRNGLLEKSEFRGRPAAFVEADKDENNVLHHAELMALLSSKKPIQYSGKKFFAPHDLDGDGLIGEREWEKLERDRELFVLMDGDRDGALTIEEVEYFLFCYERRAWPLVDESRVTIEADPGAGEMDKGGEALPIIVDDSAPPKRGPEADSKEKPAKKDDAAKRAETAKKAETAKRDDEKPEAAEEGEPKR